jgi:hypothetical protein
MIDTVEFSQGEDTEEESRIQVTLKEVRFASVKLIDLGEKLNPSRNEVQTEDKKPTGIKQGVLKSVLYKGGEAINVIN